MEPPHKPYSETTPTQKQRFHAASKTHPRLKSCPRRFQTLPRTSPIIRGTPFCLHSSGTHRRCEMLACITRGKYFRWEPLFPMLLETSCPKTPPIHTQMAPQRPQAHPFRRYCAIGFPSSGMHCKWHVLLQIFLDAFP